MTMKNKERKSEQTSRGLFEAAPVTSLGAAVGEGSSRHTSY
jgi:hypothetical protein